MLYDFTRAKWFPVTPTDQQLEKHCAATNPIIAPWAEAASEEIERGRSPRRPPDATGVDRLRALAYRPDGANVDDYQLRAVGYILSGDDTFLTALPGLGKTVMAITSFNLMALSYDHKRPKMLVIAPKSVLSNWIAELKRWLDPRPHVAAWPGPRIPDSRYIRVGSYVLGIATTDWYPTGADIVVVNYDIVGKLRLELERPAWDLLIVDECHYLKSDKAQRTAHVLGNLGAPITEKSRASTKAKGEPIMARRRLFMTGTPLNKPIDIWPMIRTMHGPYHFNRWDAVGLTMCGSDPVGKDWFTFIRRYCNAVKTKFGWDANGASNLEELGTRLAVQGMYRQDESVLNLPPHIEQTIVFQPDAKFLEAERGIVMNAIDELLGASPNDPKARNARDDLKARLSKLDPSKYGGITIEEVKGHASDGDFIRIVGESLAEQAVGLSAPLSGILFTQMSKIRYEVGLAKTRVAIPYIVNLLKEELEPDDPLLIFAYHKDCIRQISEACAEVVGESLVSTITGETKTEDRGAIVAGFQGGTKRVVVANLIAGGVGTTLTRANRCVVVESDWRATTIDQAIKRIHRRTQTRPCTTDFILLDGTLDTHVVKKMLFKRQTAYVINDKVGTTNAST